VGEFSGIVHYEAGTLSLVFHTLAQEDTHSRESFELSDICSSVWVLHTGK
jgi:hypothetical protein